MSRLRIAIQVAIVLALAAVPAMAEEFTYIVPVSGFTVSGSVSFGGQVRVINSSSVTANVRIADMIRGAATPACSPTPPVVLQPGEMARVGTKETCRGIYSLVMQSDQPVDVRSEVKSNMYGAPYLQTEQRIDVARRWIEAGETAVIADIEMYSLSGPRGNLFIANPNDFAIDVQMIVERPECCPSRAQTLSVPARTLAQFGIAPIESPPNPFPVLYEFLHNFRLTANGRFQAGASSVGSFLEAPYYRPAVILGR